MTEQLQCSGPTGRISWIMGLLYDALAIRMRLRKKLEPQRALRNAAEDAEKI
jgi:hypothetical protein